MKSKPYSHSQTPDERLTRRQFVKTAAWSVSGAALSGCGGGAGTDAVAAPSAGAGPTAGASVPANPGSTAPGASVPTAPATPAPEPPTPTPDPVEPPAAVPLPAELGRSTGATRFTLTTAIPQATTPFTLGHAFRRGDVPAGKTVAVSGLALQVVVKNRWPDGSMKFAILSGRAVLQPGVPVSYTLSVVDTTATAAPVLGTAQLRLTGVKAEFTAGSWGSASFVGADWDTPVSTWVSGPEMSSWVYRKPFALAGAADAHLMAWLEVRLYADKRIELLPWVENGYLRVPNPSNRAATYTFALNGRTEFSGAIDLKHHQRAVLLAAQATSCGVPFDTRVAVHHDGQYLQATELVPTYRPRLTPSSPAISRLPTSYAPLAAHGFVYDGDSMASGGYQSPIGLLPEHDVTYLTSDTTLSWQALMRNGFASGRYGIHYRDELTQLPLRFSDHPTYTIRSGQGFKDSGGGSNFTPVATGGNPPTWDVAHSPSVGYLAYLATGWRYFMEETQFAATANFLGNDKDIRAGTQGLVRTAVQAWQTRSCAWDWRTRSQALCITPDDHPLRQEFINTVEANIAHFHGVYVAQPNNPWGWIKPGEDVYDQARSLRIGASWQQDFVTAAFGFSLAMGLPISTTAASRLDAFFRWKAKSAVMRTGTSGEFWYVNSAPYTMVISPVNFPNYDNGTGPWYSTAKEAYDATYANPPAWFGRTEGVLAAEFLPGERSYPGNLQPALAYAVRFGVRGALEGLTRITSASNWHAMRDGFNSNPVFGVAPAVTEPVWLAGKPANTWIEIPNTSGAGDAAIDAFSGMALDYRTSEIIIASAGGHTDSSDNRVVSLSLLSDSPNWILRKAGSPGVENVSHYADGTPTSRHLYQHIHVVEAYDRVFHFGCRAAFGGPSFNFADVDAFNLSTNQWDPKNTWTAVPEGYGYGAVRIPETGDVWTTALTKWTAATKSWSAPITQGTGSFRWPIAYDSKRRQLFGLAWGDGQGFGNPSVSTVCAPVDGNARFPITLAAGPGLTQFSADQPPYAGMDYDPTNDCFLFYSGQGSAVGRVYVIRPNETTTWSISILNLASGSLLPASNPANGSGVNSRFRYVPALRGFVLLPRKSANLFFLRVAL